MPRRGDQKGWSLIELVIILGIIGVLATIAIPSFLRFQARSKQSEAKANLAGIFKTQKAYFGEHDTYGSFDQIGFKVEGGNRYTYSVGLETIDNQVPTGIVYPPANVGETAGGNGFLASATSNIDPDAFMDIWVINGNNALNNLNNDVYNSNPDPNPGPA